MTPEPVEPQTAADVYQHHLDRLGKYKKGSRFRRGLLGAVAAAVFDVLTILRNTELKAAADLAAYEAEMSVQRQKFDAMFGEGPKS